MASFRAYHTTKKGRKRHSFVTCHPPVLGLISSMDEPKPGDRVTWLREGRFRRVEVCAEVIRLFPRRVKIRVWRINSAGEKIPVVKTVDRESVLFGGK